MPVRPRSLEDSLPEPRAPAQLRFLRELRYQELQHSQHTEHSDDDDPEDLPASCQEDAKGGLPACSFLRVGQSFSGSQRVFRATSKDEDWGVTVRIEELDLARGFVCGSMCASNVPAAATPIVTHWEGEIVDNLNNTFATNNWGADFSKDMDHWAKFTSFKGIYHSTLHSGGRPKTIGRQSHIYMRWKEKFFVNVGNESDCGLTIAGFYYICLWRETGQIEGYYFDPNSAPYQKLDLRLVGGGQHGGHIFKTSQFGC